MIRRRGIRYEDGLTIAMTPIIDIVFLLLIYFMLASNFIEEQQFVVDLPQSAHGITKTASAFVITITEQGKIMADNKVVDKKGLIKMLKGLSREVKARGVEIRAERTTPVEQVVALMDVVKSCMIKKVKITTRVKDN